MNDKHENWPSTVHTLSQSCGKASRTRENQNCALQRAGFELLSRRCPSRKGYLAADIRRIGLGKPTWNDA